MSSGHHPLAGPGAAVVGLATGAYAAATAYLLFGVERADARTICACAGLLVLTYPVAARALSLRWAVAIGLALRVAAVFAWPALSDDVYRFVWDGELWLAGLHPLDAPPSAIAISGEAGAAFAETQRELLERMNSPDYHTVYPPLAQAVFAAAAYLGREVTASSMLIKLALLAADAGSLLVIYTLTRSTSRRPTVAYALHPLPIVELVGNAHFEALAVLGVLAAVYYSRATRSPSAVGSPESPVVRHLLAGGALGLGALSKLVPLVFAPALFLQAIWREGGRPRWRGGLAAAAACAGLLAAGFAVFFTGVDARGFGDSLDLYFRNFEFNGSLYALARGAGWWYRGWNWIAVVGPGLALIGAFGILLVSVIGARRRADPANTLLWCGAIYLLCATTVHPWYFAYLVALGCLTPYRWPLLLGVTALVSYVAYSRHPVAVPAWALAVEYLPPAILAAIELRWRRVSDGSEEPTLAP